MSCLHHIYIYIFVFLCTYAALIVVDVTPSSSSHAHAVMARTRMHLTEMENKRTGVAKKKTKQRRSGEWVLRHACGKILPSVCACVCANVSTKLERNTSMPRKQQEKPAPHRIRGSARFTHTCTRTHARAQCGAVPRSIPHQVSFKKGKKAHAKTVGAYKPGRARGIETKKKTGRPVLVR